MSSSPIPAPPPDASATQRGLVSTGTQTIAGDKTFTGNVTLQPADGTHPGLVTTAAQTLGAGMKTVEALATTGSAIGGGWVASTALGARFTSYGALWLGVSPAGNNYQLSSSPAGDTTLNSAPGQSITFAIGNGVVGTWSASQLSFQGGGSIVPAFLSAGDLAVRGFVVDGASAIAVKVASVNALNTAGAKVIAFYRDNGTTQVASIDQAGRIAGVAFTSPGFDVTSGTLTCGQINAGGLIISQSSAILELTGQVSDGATSIPVRIGPFAAYSNATAKLVTFNNGRAGTEKLAVDLAGKFILPTGTADAVAGNSVLSGGTVTVSTTSVKAGSVILLSRKVVGGTTGDLRVGTITAGTSFVINSASGTDTSTVSWFILN